MYHEESLDLWIVREKAMRFTIRPYLLCVALLLMTCGSSLAEQSSTAGLQKALAQLLAPGAETSSLAQGRRTAALDERVGRFYRERNFQPAWLTDAGATPQLYELLGALRASSDEGLCPEHYGLPELERYLPLLQGPSRRGAILPQSWQPQLELLLSQAYFHFASDLIGGQVDPVRIHPHWRIPAREADLGQLLTYALESRSIEPVLRDLIPTHPGYGRLRQALVQYRELAARGEWFSLPAGEVLRPGKPDPRLALLRERLALEGDFPEWSGEPGAAVLDAGTVQALKRFQARHGLAVDGILGPRTLAELNVSPHQRVRQIELSMERWRWLPQSLGERYLMVNIAGFQLQLVERDNLVLEMPVIVGTGYRKTPVFSAQMTYLEFAPTWSVPPTILREDKLPKIKTDPSYLAKNHYEIIPYTSRGDAALSPASIDWSRTTARNFPGMLRMRPGPWNPLGRVKFMFPNPFSVYLHDTNEPQLFDSNIRTFSSGCIRIQRPVELARYLLEPEGWDAARIEAAMDLPRTKRVELSQGLPVHILYWTSWVDQQGLTQFRPDLYQQDLDLEFALASR
jgi:L,D-transpeptidase YcbB